MKFINPFSNLQLSEKHRVWAYPMILIGMVIFTFIAHYVIVTTWMLKGVSFSPDGFFEDTKMLFYSKIVIATILITAVYRSIIAVYDLVRYNNREGNKISANYIYWIMSSTVLSNILFIGFAFILAFIASLIFGFERTEVYEMITNGGEKIKSIYYQIPNLINLPGFVASIFIYLVWTLSQYLNHYLGHVSRLYWLLSHRPHHTTTALSNGTGFLADIQFCISWILVILESAVVVTVSRLITQNQETIMIIFFFYAVFIQLIEIYNHSPTFYLTIKNNKILNRLFKIHAAGPYHVLHHSSHEDHQMVNLGGNSGIWDFVFGTYCDLPEEEPNFGLTNQPAFHLSATAIILGGLQQIFYELKHNKDFKTRFLIIFGGIYYKPPITKDFLIDAQGGYNRVMHRI